MHKLLFALFTLISLSANAQNNCHITGQVLDPEAKSILLKKIDQDLRHDEIIQIPVTNGKLDYSFELVQPEVFELMLGSALEENGGRFMPVFLQKGTFRITVNAEGDFAQNFISGKENELYAAYVSKSEENFRPALDKANSTRDSLIASGIYYSLAAKNLREKRKATRDQSTREAIYRKLDSLHALKLDLTEAGLRNEAQVDSIVAQRAIFQQEYIEKNPSMVAYYLFYLQLVERKEMVDVESARKIHKTLSAKFPNHRYNKLVLELINAIDGIKVGGKFEDFEAADLSGKQTRFSETLNAKVTLLDLWATWCGPCIEHSRSMLPVYEEFKSKGFEVIGVAGEFKDTKRLTEFLEKEKWSWRQFVELDRKNGIWQKYGADNGGGGLYLIADGKIIAINPTAEEVRKELLARL